MEVLDQDGFGAASELAQSVPQEEMVAALRESIPDLKVEREKLREELDNALDGCDPIELLMQAAIPYLVVDPNSYREWESTNLPAHVEYLALQILPRLSQDRDELEQIDLATRVTDVIHLVVELFSIERKLIMFSGIADRADDEDPIATELRMMSLSHSMSVRFNAFEKFHALVMEGLFEPFEEELRASIGFTAEEAMRFFRRAEALLNAAYNERGQQLPDLARRYRKAAKQLRRKSRRVGGLSGGVADLTPTQAKELAAAMACVDAFADVRGYASLTRDDLGDDSEEASAAAAWLAAFAAPADAYDLTHHRFPCPTHPLQTQPLLFDGDYYVAPVHGQLCFALPVVLEQALMSDRATASRYEDHRGKYLESAVADALAAALPGASVETRVEWCAPDGREGELDVLVSYGPATIRVQCKGGRVTPSARRGSIQRLQKDLQKLIGDAAEQHQRLREALEEHGAAALGLARLEDELTAPIQLELVVTLDDLTTVAPIVFKLRDFGTLDPDWPVPITVSLADLLVVVDLLDGSSFLHFLLRRQRLNSIGAVEALDELDWLGNYLEEGLFFDDMLAERPGSTILLASYTESIDNWYFFEEGVRTEHTEKPRQEFPPQVEELLADLESLAPEEGLLPALLIRDLGSRGREELAWAVERCRAKAAAEGGADCGLYFSRGYGLTYQALASPAVEPTPRKLLAFMEQRVQDGQYPTWVAIRDVSGQGVRCFVRGRLDPEVIDSVFIAPASNPDSAPHGVGPDAASRPVDP